jgi:hypothetical protein
VARIIRLDIINGNPRSFVAPEGGLQQGLFLEIMGKAENLLGVEDFEAYEVALASGSTERGQLLLHASVANMYDETKIEAEFVLKEGKVGRGYQPVMGDIVTIPAIGGVAVGNKLALAGNGLLQVSETNPIAVVEALEDITIPEAEPQKSMVIRFL